MARTRYASDPGLIARMGITMFLLGVVFVGFAAGLVALIEWYGSVRHGGSGIGQRQLDHRFRRHHRRRQRAGVLLLVGQDRAANVRRPPGRPE